MIDAFHGCNYITVIAQVANNVLDTSKRLTVAAWITVQNTHLITIGKQTLDEVRANKTVATYYKRFHQLVTIAYLEFGLLSEASA